tara:strand:+ start:56 stop:595 length:540 start_codon:yes stop_codon:yes gene_type:complete
MEENEPEMEDICDLPVAEEIDNNEYNVITADMITANNLDDKYILIYKNSKKIKMLIAMQGTLNFVFAILVHYWYLLITILCCTGYHGVNKYKYPYMLVYNIYLLIDFCYHVVSFIYTFRETSFMENSLNFFIASIYIWLLSTMRNHIKSIKNLTEDEILLLRSIKITPSNVESQNILLI